MKNLKTWCYVTTTKSFTAAVNKVARMVANPKLDRVATLRSRLLTGSCIFRVVSGG